MHGLYTILFWLVVTWMPAFAADVTPAVGRVWIVERGNVESMGSCVLVSRKPAIALTAAHVVMGITDSTAVAIHFTEVSPVVAYKATVVEARPKLDVAVLAIAGDPQVTPRPISWEPVMEGRRVWQSGWGNYEQKARSRWGVSKGNLTFREDDDSLTFLVAVSPLVRGGDSGGGVFDGNGKLVGIIRGTVDLDENGHADSSSIAPLAENQWIKPHLRKRP